MAISKLFRLHIKILLQCFLLIYQLISNLQRNPLISFAVKLYPYFDQGWATTVNKSQGSTADKAFLLASNHFNRNLSYVGMTRHRESVEVFGTDSEFWNGEVMTKQMAKAAEKLSSLDYLDANQALRLVHQEHSIIKTALDKVQTHLSAAHYIAKRSLNTWLGKPPVSHIIHPQESITEAQRAQLLELEKQRAYFKGQEKEPLSFPLKEQPVGKEALKAVEEALKPDVLKETSTLPKESLKIASPADQFKESEKDESISLEKSDKYDGSTFINATHKEPPKKEFYDRDQVFQKLDSHHIEAIIRDHIHHWVDSKGEKRSTDELRLGAKSGFVVNLKTGMWFSHYHGQGGDIFKYVSESKNISYQESIKEIALTNGVALEKSTASITHSFLKEYKQDQKKLQQGKEKSQNMWNQTVPLAGTCGEVYLREKRHITGEPPEDIRFIPERRLGKQTLASLVSFARDSQGEITGFQEIFLNPKTSEKASGLDVVKRSGGYCKGSTVCIQQGNGNTFIAEGIETALSLKSAGIQGEILSGFGRFVFKNALPTNKNVVLCADYDGTNAPTHKALLTDKAFLESKGYEVSILWPATTGEQKVDFNDVLKKEGPLAIQQMVEKQLDYKYEPLAQQYSERAKEALTTLKAEQSFSHEQEKTRIKGPHLSL